MAKPGQVGRGLAAVTVTGASVDHVANNGQTRKAAIDMASDAIGGGSSTVNAASTPTSTGGGEMVTGLPPTMLGAIALAALAVIAIVLWLQDDG